MLLELGIPSFNIFIHYCNLHKLREYYRLRTRDSVPSYFV